MYFHRKNHPGDIFVFQTDRSCDCASGKSCVASDRYIEQLEDVLRFCCPKGRVGGMFAESIQVKTSTAYSGTYC